MGWLKKIDHEINDNKTLEDRFFSVVVIVGLAIVAVSEIVTMIENIGVIANIGTAMGGILLLIVVYEAYIRKRPDRARILICYAFNCVVIPIAFFSCGGFDSGMPIYMLAGIFTIIPVLKEMHRFVCLLVSFTFDIVCISIAYFLRKNPYGFIATKLGLMPELDLKARYIDIVSSLLIISVYIIVTTALIMDAYQKERAKREELLEKLDDLSKRDELTGLYNRREMFRFLEETSLTDGKYFLCMVDIDHFKNVNDTYGHVFGDVVLRTLAGIFNEEILVGEGELAARYGGEEFLIVVKAEQKEQAKERINCVRDHFEKTVWESQPDLVITFSAGMVDCAAYKSYAEAISQADKLLYKAKENGRNRLEISW